MIKALLELALQLKRIADALEKQNSGRITGISLNGEAIMREHLK